MVGHFVRLKSRLLANRLRTQSILGTIGFILIWVGSIVGGLLGGLGVAGLGRLVDEPGLILVVAYTVVFLGWLVIPAMASALDETLDPRRFELLPLAAGRLTTGLAVAGAVGPGGIATFIGLVVATFGSFPDWSLFPVLIVAVLVQLLLCLLVARLVTTVLANVLADRRMRELATLVFGLGIAFIAFLPALIGGDNGPQFEVSITSLDDFSVLSWLPPGALAQSVDLASRGAVLNASGLAAYGLAATLIVGWLWARAVRRMMETAPTASGRGRSRNRLDRPLALLPSRLRFRSWPAVGMVGKELRYLIRENRVRAQLIGSLATLIVVVFVSRGDRFDPVYTPFLAAGVVFFLVIGTLTNQFGYDGGSFWGYVVSSVRLVDVVRGKNLTWGLLSALLALLVAAGMAIWQDEYTYMAAGFFAALGVILVAMAISNVTSIYGAYAIPESNPFGNRGASGAVFVAVMLSMAAAAIILTPLALMIIVPLALAGPLAATVGSMAGIVYGIGVYWMGLKVTSRLLAERQQTLLETIDHDRA